ncbi:hypothetical protein WJX74_008452 [Apatococcus lobatus]|uniref:Uncharacterized protein n=1 Tax=Apatococcus lobatus TaxID=904363 RepID=A0AAW1RSQ1_9CHLO
MASRSRRRFVTVASSHENLITDDRRNSALDFQLKRSTARQPQAAKPEVPAQSSSAAREADLAERKLAARAWITPWLDVRTKGESSQILRAMQKRVAMMDDGRADNAMSRQLNKGRFLSKEEIAAQADSPSEGESTSQDDSRYAPSQTYEDGSLLFSSSTLGSSAAPSS